MVSLLDTKGVLEKVLQKFSINDDTKSVSTLLVPHFQLKATMSSSTVEERKYISLVLYVNVVGNFMYAMICNKLSV